MATELCHVFWTRRQSQTVSEYCQLLKTAREDFILHYGHFFKELIKVSVTHQAKTVHKLSIRQVWRHQSRIAEKDRQYDDQKKEKM